MDGVGSEGLSIGVPEAEAGAVRIVGVSSRIFEGVPFSLKAGFLVSGESRGEGV